MRAVILITGASSGLGAEFARQLAKRGHRLVLAARRKDRLDELISEIRHALPWEFGVPRSIAIDLAQPGAAAKLIGNLEAAGEYAEILINNAGFGLWGRFAELDAARQREMIDLNCGALTDLCSAVVPGMIERGTGAILNVASTAAFQSGPGMAVYFATKAYVLSFTEALHEELNPHGVHVTALCPGPTRTEFGHVAGFGGSPLFNRFAMESAPVVRAGLDGLRRNRAIVIPGELNKLSGQGHRLLPRALLRKIVAAIKV